MRAFTALWCGIICACMVLLTRAHVPYFEPELFNASPEATSDWSLESPFELPLSAADGYSPSLNNSRALYSLLGLSPNDTYDAAAFNVTAGGMPQYIIGLEILVPDCPSYVTFYPSLALLGPSSDPRFPPPTSEEARSLPFKVPKGYGIIIRNPPRADRSVFADNPVQSYLLSAPLTPSCLYSQDLFYSCGNGTARKTSIITQLPGQDAPLGPGRYYVTWWDPEQGATKHAANSTPRETIVTLGVGENPTPKERAIQMAVMTGQEVPRFSPCQGTFISASIFAAPGEEAPVRLVLPPSHE